MAGKARPKDRRASCCPLVLREFLHVSMPAEPKPALCTPCIQRPHICTQLSAMRCEPVAKPAFFH